MIFLLSVGFRQALTNPLQQSIMKEPEVSVSWQTKNPDPFLHHYFFSLPLTCGWEKLQRLGDKNAVIDPFNLRKSQGVTAHAFLEAAFLRSCFNLLFLFLCLYYSSSGCVFSKL